MTESKLRQFFSTKIQQNVGSFIGDAAADIGTPKLASAGCSDVP
jgi:hypothetical protein